MKIIIIGGVAGGASAAAKIRRNDESAEIIMFERGDYVSFANCGLPYHISGVISERDSLLVMTPEKLKARANIDVRVKEEVIGIDSKNNAVTVKKRDGAIYREKYDKLIISTGSTPIIPKQIKGIDNPTVNVLWNINDMDKIIKKVNSGAKNVVIVGAGFIGLELAENMVHKGLQTSIVEMQSSLLPQLDIEMSQPLKEEALRNGISIYLNSTVTEIEENNGTFVVLQTGIKIPSDLIIFCAGVRPNTEIAKLANINLNSKGGIIVNNRLETNIHDIYAIGDAVQITEIVSNTGAMIPLAGPANRQGRVVADIITGKKAEYKGAQGTAILKFFSKTAAFTGLTENQLKLFKIEYEKFYTTPSSHASYYPNSEMMFIKILHDTTGNILGSQILGGSGVDKRIDILSVAVRNKMNFSDLEEMELAYAPPYGSAKDPINFIGYIGNNILNKTSELINSDEIPKDSYLIDVREEDEYICGTIKEAVNIPLGKIRHSLENIPKDREILVFCKAGLRGYIAERILKHNGFSVKNLSGGYEVYKLFNPDKNQLIPIQENKNENITKEEIKTMDIKLEINACGLQCPGPIIKIKDGIEKISFGEFLSVKTTDLGSLKDIPAWCNSTGNTVIDIKSTNNEVHAIIQKGNLAKNENILSSANSKKSSIVLFSNDLDKAMAAMIIATGFASLGHEVSIFFTFWGINVLRKSNPPNLKKDFLSKMFGLMMPRGPEKLALSKMKMMGLGTHMMKNVMKGKNVASLPELMEQAQKMGVKFLVCEMAMNVMGIQEEELIENVERAGVANFAAISENCNTTLFI